MTTQVLKRRVGIYLGKAERPIGQLTYIKDGAREYSSFAYDNPWLAIDTKTGNMQLSLIVNNQREIAVLRGTATLSELRAGGIHV